MSFFETSKYVGACKYGGRAFPFVTDADRRTSVVTTS
jgi:hypothetical protein